MAKTRAQRKAEKREREKRDQQRKQREPAVGSQAPVESSADAAVRDAESRQVAQAPEPASAQPSPQVEEREPKAAKSEKAEERKRRRRERKAKEAKPPPPPPSARKAPAEERRRGVVLGFLASSWAELKRVQWPNRDTLIQASAVTLIFVAIAAAYLGALDTAFNWVVKQIL